MKKEKMEQLVQIQADNEKLQNLRQMNIYLRGDKDHKEREIPKYVHADLNMLYEKAYEELALQQSKRDQLIGLYVTVISLLASSIVSSENGLDLAVKGYIFLFAAVIGFLLAMVVVRYRIYKEVYWLNCQTLTVMMNLDETMLDEDRIKAIFVQVMHTKAKSYIREDEEKGETFLWGNFVWKGLFSAETIYYIIQALCASALLGVGVVFAFGMTKACALWHFVGVTIGALLVCLGKYFYELIEIYRGIWEMDRFRKAFKKAWFLHMFVSPPEKKEETV